MSDKQKLKFKSIRLTPIAIPEQNPSEIIDILKNMDKFFVDKLYADEHLDTTKVKEISYRIICTHQFNTTTETLEYRPIIYVINITSVNGDIAIVNQGMYLSTGTSRYDTNLEGYWLPTTGIIVMYNDDYKKQVRLVKNEDKFIIKYSTYIRPNEKNSSEETMLLKYGRFIDFYIARLSKCLYNNIRLIDIEKIVINPNDYDISSGKVIIDYSTFNTTEIRRLEILK